MRLSEQIGLAMIFVSVCVMLLYVFGLAAVAIWVVPWPLKGLVAAAVFLFIGCALCGIGGD